jgi:hypothetical protein
MWCLPVLQVDGSQSPHRSNLSLVDIDQMESTLSLFRIVDAHLHLFAVYAYRSTDSWSKRIIMNLPTTRGEWAPRFVKVLTSR